MLIYMLLGRINVYLNVKMLGADRQPCCIAYLADTFFDFHFDLMFFNYVKGPATRRFPSLPPQKTSFCFYF